MRILNEPKVKPSQRFLSPTSMSMIRWTKLPYTWNWKQTIENNARSFELLYGHLWSFRNVALLILILTCFAQGLLVLLGSIASKFLGLCAFEILLTLLIFYDRNRLFISKLSNGEISSVYLFYNVFISIAFQIIMTGTFLLVCCLALLDVRYIVSSTLLTVGLVIAIIAFMIGISSLTYYMNLSRTLWLWAETRVTHLTEDDTKGIPQKFARTFLSKLFLEAERKQLNDAGKLLAQATDLPENSFSDIIANETTSVSQWERVLLNLPKVATMFMSLIQLVALGYSSGLFAEILRRL